MPHPRPFRTVAAGVLVLAVLSASAHAQPAAGTLGTVPLPGGLDAALELLDDPLPADRAHFLVDLIRRANQRPLGPKGSLPDPILVPLLDHLDRAARPANGSDPEADILPLPLRLETWNAAIFGAPVAAEDVVRTILQSRDLSLLYTGLLWLDEETRGWLEQEPALLTEIAEQHAATFLLAAPGLRIAGGSLNVPGGKRAEPLWQALVGHPIDRPHGFVRALLSRDQARLAYFFGEMAQLSAPQLDVVLDLASAEDNPRIASGRRLYAVYQRLTNEWRAPERTFWRPRLDPGTLVGSLRTTAEGHPLVPGTREFWTSAFRQQKGRRNAEAAKALADGPRAGFVWLCEQVFNTGATEQDRRYHMVLFASRNIAGLTPQTSLDALEAVRGAGTYPALLATLERAGLRDLGAMAAAAQRAAHLVAISDATRAVRALAQFQGMLGILTRAASRRAISAEALPALVSSLAAVDLSDRGDYEGALVVWLDTHVAGSSAASVPSGDSSEPMETPTPITDDLLRLASGAPDDVPQYLEWEDTRYRVDLAYAESVRIRRLLEPETEACLTSARRLVEAADTLAVAGLSPEAGAREAEALENIGRAVDLDGPRWTSTDVPARFGQAADALRRAASGGNPRDAARLGSSIRLLADDLLAQGLLEFFYAVAIGHPELASASPIAIAARHDFGLRVPVVGRLRAWQLPSTGAESPEGWRVTGSLLGLDVALSDFWLRRVSLKPPSRRPSLDPESRRVFVDTTVLIEPADHSDASLRTIATALRRGRERLAGTKTIPQAWEVADLAGLSTARGNLLAWTVSSRPGEVQGFLSTRELFWLGLGADGLPGLDAWGVVGSPRTGCLCLQVFDRRPWEILAGRWHAGILASAVPDLTLRVAELLEELQMSASLVAPVLAPATSDFVRSAEGRGRDDYRGLTAVVHTLTADMIEEYLALLTTGGPLVPVSDVIASDRGKTP